VLLLLHLKHVHTVAEKVRLLQKLTVDVVSPFSATVALFCDSVDRALDCRLEEGLKRPVGRLRTTCLRTIDDDIQAFNFGVHKAWREATLH